MPALAGGLLQPGPRPPMEDADQDLSQRLARADSVGHHLDRLPIHRPGPAAGSWHARPSPQAARAPIQARWKTGPNEGEVYWEGRGEPDEPAPHGARVVSAPPLAALEDVSRGGSGGSMKSLRTQPDFPEADLALLAHVSSQASSGKGLFYAGPSEERGLGPTPVATSIPRRDPGEHRTIFSQMTGGEPSSTRYQEQLGTAEPDTSYQILHGVGHGEGGRVTQDPQNLASASEGANTEMIPFDKAISGNPEVLVDTSFTMRAGTERAEVIHQRFAHQDFPSDYFHHRDIDADRPKPTRSEYEGLEAEASAFAPANLDAAASMIHLSRRPSPKQEGRLDAEASKQARIAATVALRKRHRQNLLNQHRRK